jgi:hypothetical protein
MRRTTTKYLFAAVLAAFAASHACGDQISLVPVADSSIYSEPFAVLTNGSGQYIFAGKVIRSEYVRRAILRFDLSSIPAGSTINAVALQLYMSRTIAGPLPFALHRMNASWGEGASDPEGQEGGGTDPVTGDSTWFYRFWQTTQWATPGGDFIQTASASTVVDQNGFYTWASSGLVADVQTWLATASANHGWILIGPEDEHSAKRFDSRENPVPANRPTLIITFTPPVTLCQGDADNNGQVNFADITAVLGNFNADYTPVLNGQGDANHDGVVNFADVTTVLARFGLACA